MSKRDALKDKHCETCAMFHQNAPGVGPKQGYCVAHPPRPFVVAMMPVAPPAIVDPKNPPPMQAKPVVQCFYPATDHGDGCWEHRPAVDMLH